MTEGEETTVYMLTMASETSERDIVWNSDTIYALGRCRMLAQSLGIWPLQCQDLFSKIRLLVVIILEISMAINLIREIIADCVAVEDMVNYLALVACSTLACLKVTVLRINQTRMELVIKSAVKDWSRVADDAKQRKIMRGYACTGRFVFIFQMSLVLATLIPYVLGSLPFLATSGAVPSATNDLHLENTTMMIKINNYSNISTLYSSVLPQRSLPMGTACFFSDISTSFYSIMYVIQVIQLITACFGTVGIDAYFFEVTMHVCGQFELLRMNFETFGEDHDLHVDKCHEQLGKLVRRHNHLIKLSNNFEDIFNIIILSQLSANVVHMSLVGIKIIINIQLGNGMLVAAAVTAFWVLSIQILVYSYAGDHLSTQIENNCYATYCCRWYDLPPKIVRDLMFVMSRSNVAFHLTAGKVYWMNMENFKNIFKAMVSYFSMIRIMFDA